MAVRIFKATLVTSVSALLLAVLLIAGLHLHFVQPHHQEVAEIIAAEPSPPIALYRLAALSETPAGIAQYAGRLLADRYAPRSGLAALYWSSVIPHLYTEAEAFKLWVSLAPHQHGQGLRSAAQFYYGKGLSELSEPQLAELVVMVRAPTVFVPGSARANAQAHKLLTQAAGT